MKQLNSEDFTDESAERLTFTEVEELDSLNFLHLIDQEEVIQLLISIITDADNQGELIKYLVNWNLTNRISN